FLRGAEIISKFNDSRVLVHCENASICDELGREAQAQGRITAHDYVASRPVYTEIEAIRRVLYLAKVANCPIHICHISSPEGVAEVTKARNE
ncbi:allantoinase, partial [Enterobacter cloacae complex sp.6701988]